MFKQINFRQTKYMLPLVVYLPIVFIAYFMIDAFYTETIPEKSKMESMNEYNNKMPEPNVDGDGIGNRMQNMQDAYGNVSDFTAVENIDRTDSLTNRKEGYDSKYSSEELNQLNQEQQHKATELERLRELQEKMRHSQNQQPTTSASPSEVQTQEQALAELNKVLNQARGSGQKGIRETMDSIMNPSAGRTAIKVQGTAATGTADPKEELPKAVTKAARQNSSYFNTIQSVEQRADMIKAIIDEEVKASDGSRIRLRLLEDIVIDDALIPKGTHLYATVSGFGSQRVKGKIESILLDGELVKVSLSLYDTDGMEGLYVPSSKFRETMKNVASGSMTGGSINTSTSGQGSIAQMGMQALTNAYSSVTNAISTNVKKNRAKLKYSTYVYLVNESTKNK